MEEKEIMKQYKWDNKEPIMAHEILFTYTSSLDYDMDRLIMLKRDGKLIFLEGSHCSCFDFDECTWEATEFDYYDNENIKKFLMQYDYYHLREKALEFFKDYNNEEV